MCDFGQKALSQQLLMQQQEAKRTAAQAALDETLAQQKAAAALVNPIDSESARKTAEQRMRKLLSTQPIGPTLGVSTPAPVGYKMLLGA